MGFDSHWLQPIYVILLSPMAAESKAFLVHSDLFMEAFAAALFMMVSSSIVSLIVAMMHRDRVLGTLGRPANDELIKYLK